MPIKTAKMLAAFPRATVDGQNAESHRRTGQKKLPYRNKAATIKNCKILNYSRKSAVQKKKKEAAVPNMTESNIGQRRQGLVNGSCGRHLNWFLRF